MERAIATRAQLTALCVLSCGITALTLACIASSCASSPLVASPKVIEQAKEFSVVLEVLRHAKALLMEGGTPKEAPGAEQPQQHMKQPSASAATESLRLPEALVHQVSIG